MNKRYTLTPMQQLIEVVLIILFFFVCFGLFAKIVYF
jgi:hypothetical protein